MGLEKGRKPMELKEQVCSLELAKKLKDLEVEQDSLWYWYAWHNDERVDLIFKDKDIGFGGGSSWSAFTVAELGEKLKGWDKFNNMNHLPLYDKQVKKWNSILGDDYLGVTEANARAKMLIYLLENKK